MFFQDIGLYTSKTYGKGRQERFDSKLVLYILYIGTAYVNINRLCLCLILILMGIPDYSMQDRLIHPLGESNNSNCLGV